MFYKRRLLLRGMLSFTTAFSALALMPGIVFAKWSKAFDADTTDDALLGMFDSKELVSSDQIKFKIPEIAENGAVVPVTVKTDLPNVSNISIFAEKNPQPLAASFTIPEGTAADVSVRIRLGETMNVTAVVKADGKLYSTQKEVKVTIGGCGG